MNISRRSIGWGAVAAAVIVAFALGFLTRGGSGPAGTVPDQAGHAHDATAGQATVWTCSMHPQIRMPGPGQCPICGMDLIPVESGDTGTDEGGPSLTLSERARKLAEVQTTPVTRRDVRNTLRMVGKLEADETRVRSITAWVPGRIEKLYVDFTGVPVRRGDKLFDLYSPDLYAAQEELIQSLRAGKDLEQSTLASTRESANRTVEATRERLRLLGLNDDQVSAIESRGTPSERTTITAPISGIVLHKDAVEGMYVQTGTRIFAIADLSTLWLKLDAYESDVPWIAVGQAVTFETESYPGETFTGTVSFIDPVLDERARTVKLRVDVPNDGGRLLPGMFARAETQAPVTRPQGEAPLVIPASAPLITGTRAVVYVADPDQEGRYEGREIALGPRAGDYYVVRSGLREGEAVVTHGNFKIDSELQIQAGPSMMSPETTPAPPRLFDVPDAFRARVDDLLTVYYEVTDALSHDDVATAQAAARRLQGIVEGMNADVLSSEARHAWEDDRAMILDRAARLAGAEDIHHARDHFFYLSNALIETVRRFGTSGRQAVRLYHCPMARQSEGADWLSAKTETENPYYGSMMFRCGAEADVLVAAKTGE